MAIAFTMLVPPPGVSAGPIDGDPDRERAHRIAAGGRGKRGRTPGFGGSVALEKRAGRPDDSGEREGRRFRPREGDGAGLMRWEDRVHGTVTIEDPRLLALIAGPTF